MREKTEDENAWQKQEKLNNGAKQTKHDDDDGKWEWRVELNCIAYTFIEIELESSKKEGMNEKKKCIQRNERANKKGLESRGHHAVRSMKIKIFYSEIFAIFTLDSFRFFHLQHEQENENFSKICLRANKSRFYRVTWFIRKCCCTWGRCDTAVTKERKSSIQ